MFIYINTSLAVGCTGRRVC